MLNYFDRAREHLRKIYGRRFMAFRMDEVEMVSIFLWLNDKHGVKLH
jgi:hypothetical protein